ncbi:hypothetical protein K8Z61_01090 [Nocardioides sp. TRM66260-LWL]|uniref:hypothetical protein n=1 Tax=Nocardioides sp. TRM66260-LWL TaxID=2874478 RepID=UPI001CC5C838|nr:hypothetical protein [Nocardioides sp. TRM66260-LWL]MBZ5733078.1 hypothetical protein [Nocardioides sp. TRM66260-LWL]
MTESFLARIGEHLRDQGRRVDHRGTSAHGDPPTYLLDGALDRAEIEGRFDLGPLARWSMLPTRGWCLTDLATWTWFEGTATGGAWLPGSVDRSGERVRLGWPSQEPRLVRERLVPTLEQQLAVLAGRLDGARLVAELGGQSAWGVITPREGVPTARLRASLAELLSAIGDGTGRPEDLPAWLGDARVGDRDQAWWDGWVARAGEPVEPSERSLLRAEAHWTRDHLLQALAPGERTWWVAQAVDVPDGLALRVVTATSHVSSSLAWPLHRAGAVDCRRDVLPEGVLGVPARWVSAADPGPDGLLVAEAHRLLGLPDRLPFVLDRSGFWQHAVDHPLTLDAGSTPAPGIGVSPRAAGGLYVDGSEIVGTAVPRAPRPSGGRRRWWWRR